MLQIDEPKSGLSVSLINSYFAFHIFLFSFLLFSITALLQSQAAQAHYVWVRASEVIWSEYTRIISVLSDAK